MKPVRLGLAIRTSSPSDIVALVRTAASSGYRSVWFSDSPRYPDVFVQMTLAATVLETSPIEIGCAVTNLETRDEAVVANAIASVAAISPNSVTVGLGLGHSAVLLIGRQPTSFDAFSHRFAKLKALLHGQLEPNPRSSNRLPMRPRSPIRLLIAGDGPRMRAFSAKHADGSVLNPGAMVPYVRATTQEIYKRAGDAARNPEVLKICAWTRAAIADSEDEALKLLRVSFGPQVARDVARMRRAAWMDSDEVTTNSMETIADGQLRQVALVGTAERCAERIAELSEIHGLTDVIVALAGENPQRDAEKLGNELVSHIGS